MYILGVSGQYRDAAAALLRDGQIVAAQEEDKLRGINRIDDEEFGGLPLRSIEFCLQSAGISIEDIDHVAYYLKPWRSVWRQLKFDARQMRAGPVGSFYHGIASLDELRERLRSRNLIKRILSNGSKIASTDHQLAHAASSFYLSRFDRAAILVLGGVGDFVTIATGIGEDSRIRILDRIEFPNSLGWVYSLITRYIGFRPHLEEHKTQWLSVTGEPEFLPHFRNLIDLDRRGVPVINLSYFVPLRGEDPFSEEFYKRFGDHLRCDLRRLAHQRQPGGQAEESRWREAVERSSRAETILDDYRRNLACSLQHRLEEIVMAMADELCARLKVDNLCLAGGVALNSLLVSRFARSSRYKHVFVQPAAGNTGAGLGAALYYWHNQCGGRRSEPLQHIFLGPEYTDQEIKPVLDNCKLTYRFLPSERKLIEEVVEMLSQGRIVAWFQGRAEFGPRSLGARSILANPQNAFIKENLNRFVKHREDFRPFGVSIPEEDAQEFFEDCGPLSEFLLTASRVREDKRRLVGAACFSDGLARVHTVTRKANPLFWRLLKRFGERTGVPALFNTSFNLLGNPLASTPRDAVRSFYCSGIDGLAINHFLLEKG